jgi:hypothetical protein
MKGCHNKINPKYKFTAQQSHFTDTCQTYPSSKRLAKWTLWIRYVHNKIIIRCHQSPRIIQVYQNNTWAHSIEMYDWKYPNKIIWIQEPKLQRLQHGFPVISMYEWCLTKKIKSSEYYILCKFLLHKIC